jgi:lysozyme
MMQITRQGLVMIQMFEQLRSCPYRDAAGNWTIGWGHRLYDDEYEEDYYRGEDQEPRCIEKGEATELLIEDIKTAMAGVTKHVTVPLTANQFTALVSFVFNLGEGNLAKSTLLKKLNAGDYEGAAIQFQSWTKARVKGKLKPLTGLVARRRAEELVFRSPDVVYVPAHDVWVGKPGEESLSSGHLTWCTSRPMMCGLENQERKTVRSSYRLTQTQSWC